MHNDTLNRISGLEDGWTESEKIQHLLKLNTCLFFVFFPTLLSVLSLYSGSAGASSFCQVYRLWIRDPPRKADHRPSAEGHTRSHFSMGFVSIANCHAAANVFRARQSQIVAVRNKGRLVGELLTSVCWYQLISAVKRDLRIVTILFYCQLFGWLSGWYYYDPFLQKYVTSFD